MTALVFVVLNKSFGGWNERDVGVGRGGVSGDVEWAN